jgi:hypothetical protein
LRERKQNLIEEIRRRKQKLVEIENCDQNLLKALKEEAKDLASVKPRVGIKKKNLITHLVLITDRKQGRH